METTDKRDPTPSKRTRRSFSRTFKAELVAQAERGDVSVSQLAMQVLHHHKPPEEVDHARPSAKTLIRRDADGSRQRRRRP